MFSSFSSFARRGISTSSKIVCVSVVIASQARVLCQAEAQGAENNNEEEDPCAKYNTFMSRVNWASRKEKCLSEPGCKFSGWRSLGTCELDESYTGVRRPQNGDVNSSNGNNGSNNNSNNNGSVNGKNKSGSNDESGSSQEEKLNLLDRINKATSDNIAESLIDSMKALTPSITASTTGAVSSGLQRTPQTTATMAKFVTASLQAPKIEENLRWNLLWLIQSQMTYDNAYYQAKYQRDYWLMDPEGYAFAEKQLVDFSHWYLTHPGTHKDLIVPMLEWTLLQKEMVFAPAVQAINEALNSKDTKVTIYVAGIVSGLIVS
jgi:hypothetical protein